MKVKVESEKLGLKLNIQKTKIMASGPITSWEIDGETVETVSDFIFGGSKITADDDCSQEIKRCLLLGRKVMINLDSILKSRNITDKGVSSQSYGSSRSHVWMWKLDYKESCEPKNWCFWAVVLEKTLESSLDRKEIKSVNPKGNQSWIVIGRTDAEAPIFWPPDGKNWLIWKDWCWERLKVGGEEDDRGWDGWMSSPTQWTWVEKTLGAGDGRGSLACCSPWGYKELDMTERLSWTELKMLRRKLCQVSALRGPGPPILTDSPRAAPYTTPTSSVGFLTTGEICFLQTNGLYPGCV